MPALDRLSARGNRAEGRKNLATILRGGYNPGMDHTVVKNDSRPVDGLPPGIHVQLSFLSGPDRGMVKRLWKQTTTIGRAGDIAITDPASSKLHASLSWENGALILRDLESTNGTMLAGGRVWEAVVTNLDEIAIGETAIQVAILMEKEGAAEDSDSSVAVVESESIGDTTLPRPIVSSPAAEVMPENTRAVVQVVEGADAGQRIPLSRRVTIIGRTGADIVLKDLSVSRRHATIEFMDHQRVFIKDLESRNGTLLNRKRVSVAPLKNGDSIQLGATVLTFFVSFNAPRA